MDKEQNIEIQLWDYLDGVTLPQERPEIEKLIAENMEWRIKYKELLEIRELVNAIELEQPSLRFTKNVMEGIAKYNIAPATKKYINHKVIWGIGLFFLAAISGFLVYGISQINWKQGSSDNILGVDLNKLNYSPMFNNNYLNIFMMLNVILGLMLLDRFLSIKRKQFKEA